MTPELLLDYGLHVDPDQSRAIMKELLSLTLYWIGSALQANFRPEAAECIMKELQHRIEQGWRDLGMQGFEPAAVFKEAKIRQAVYHQMLQEGGSLISVFGESARFLEFEGVIEAGHHQHVLALLIDFVPVDTFGEVLDGIELTGF